MGVMAISVRIALVMEASLLFLPAFAADLSSSALATNSAPRWAQFAEPNYPFFSSVLDARKPGLSVTTNNLTPRGLILNLGHDCWACFDIDLLRMSAIWNGKGISPVSMSQGSYNAPGWKVPEGQEMLPKIIGVPWIENGIYPGWQLSATRDQFILNDPREAAPEPKEVGRGPLPPGLGRFQGIGIEERRIRLEYEIAGTQIEETVEARSRQLNLAVQRRFRLQNVRQPLWLIIGQKPANGPKPFVQIIPGPGSRRNPIERVDQDKVMALRVPASPIPVEFTVLISQKADTASWTIADPPPRTVQKRWEQSVRTESVVSRSRDAFVVDRVLLPSANPWKRNLRLADLAFFKDGRAAAVTFDGDVWIISGLGGDMKEVEWRRFTSGLHEPLSIAIRGEELFVFDRNGIWRLRDTDGNGEADRHELFSNAFTQTAETREYANGMKVAPDGSFIIAKGGQQASTIGRHNGSVLRISPDGKTATVLGWGLRQPFIGVDPLSGLITASDQQGHYVPATPIQIVQDNQFYGFLSNLLPKEKYPAPIANPLTWIPHSINASAAGEVWLTDERMGPLKNTLIHLGYYRPEIFHVSLNRRAPQLQASVLSLTRDLDFAPLNGAVGPVDGQLYVIGFQIWGSIAREISGLARLRYTGAPSTFPREIIPTEKGILLRFNVLLDTKIALNPDSYSAERWNYIRTANYGSPHFKTDGSKGQEGLPASSVYLSKDAKAVFVGIRDMKPVMQMRFGWALVTEDGRTSRHNAYFTPYQLTRFDPVSEGFEPLVVDLTPRSILASAPAPKTAGEGQRVADLMGCVACHSNDGSLLGKIGPTWKGLFGSKRLFQDGTSALADEAYLRQSIRELSAKIVKGFDNSDTGMPSYDGVISDAQIEALILYIKSLQ